MLGFAYAAAGKTAEAQEIVRELAAASEPQFGAAFALARIHAALGDNDQALESLRRACDERDPTVFQLKIDPSLDSLRADPRFSQLVKQVGFTP
jgi:hypothetical protein